jgi:hypothetical protein
MDMTHTEREMALKGRKGKIQSVTCSHDKVVGVTPSGRHKLEYSVEGTPGMTGAPTDVEAGLGKSVMPHDLDHSPLVH